MAQTNYTPISLYYSTTAAAAPVAGNLVNGELAINITDGKLYYKDNLGAVKVIAGAGGAGVAGGSNTQVQYNSSGSLAGSANMTFDGTTLTVNGLSTTGTVTIGDASGDALTINSSAVSIPNGLNFDSNTFVIDATNNRVGVGTASPANTLDVTGAANSVQARFGATAGRGLEISVIPFGATVNATTVLNALGAGNGTLTFQTESSERMRITSTGNVGIGTSSPSYKLDVAGLVSSQDAYLITANSSGVPSAGAFMYRPASNTLAFGTASAERMRLDSSGNLGLGVTPSAWSGYTAAQIINSSFYGKSDNTVAGVGLNYYNNGTNDIYRVTYNASKYEQAGGQHRWFNAPSGTAGNAITFTQAMTLDASGRLLVGATSGSDYLTVQGTANEQTTLSLNNTSASGNNYRLISNTGGSLVITSDATERMRIDSSGNTLFAKAVRATITTDNDLSFDMNAASNFKCTPTGGGALTFTNITSGQTGNIILVNGSNYAITAAATTKVSSTCLATISATGTYWLSYYSDGTNVYVANTGALA